MSVQSLFNDVAPNVEAFDKETVYNFFERIQKSNLQKDGLSQGDADFLMRWLISNTRRVLMKIYEQGEQDFLQNNLRGACGFASSATAFPLEEIGVEVNLPNIRDFHEEQRHAYAVITLPIVQSDGTLRKQHYLFDATFKQFCDVSDILDPLERQPGYKMSQTEQGRIIAAQILSKGYVALTPDVAKIYAEAFNIGETPARSEPQDYLDTMLDKEFYYNDYDPEELEEWGYDINIPRRPEAHPVPTKKSGQRIDHNQTV